MPPPEIPHEVRDELLRAQTQTERDEIMLRLNNGGRGQRVPLAQLPRFFLGLPGAIRRNHALLWTVGRQYGAYQLMVPADAPKFTRRGAANREARERSQHGELWMSTPAL